MSKGLLDEKPLLILPTLATKIGLNESIILQQIHYWLINSENIHDEKKWVYNSYENWQKQFPFWSKRTIERLFETLCKSGILIKNNYNKMGIDRTNWYTINYEKLAELSITTKCRDHDDKLTRPTRQNDVTNNQRVLTENTPKKNQKIKHREFVYLSDEELKLLQDKFGNTLTDKAIEKLDNYKGATGKRYKSDYRAILSWVVDSLQTKKGTGKKENLPEWYDDRKDSHDQVDIEQEKKKLTELLKREK